MRANAGTWLTLVIDLGRREALVVRVLAHAGWLAGVALDPPKKGVV